MKALDYDVARMLIAHNIIIEPLKKEPFWYGTTHETRLFSINFCSLAVKYDAETRKSYVNVTSSKQEIPYNFAEKIYNRFENEYGELPQFDYQTVKKNKRSNISANTEDQDQILVSIKLYTLEELQFVLELLGKPKAEPYVTYKEKIAKKRRT